MLAYHSNPVLKSQFVEEMERHQREDMICQLEVGTVDKNDGKWKGCHVACAVHSMSIIRGLTVQSMYNHELWPDLLGIPVWMAFLCETVFEALDEDAAKLFPVAFSKAVKPGKDMETVRMPLILFVMERAHQHAEGDHKQVLERILGLWQQLANGENVATEQWSEAREAARAVRFSAKQSRVTATELDKDICLMQAANLWHDGQMGDDSLNELVSISACTDPQGVQAATKAFADKLLELVAE